ncbi:MAG TPA: Crp/Fnr family transcriptional regulator [Candidatus Sulfotelmatobacter sp.]|jgi:CRP/FNR family transcriptional regulator|nr:Crp/Fnr family transcriptional regulator [Candidatus Sulfotelmatobacter sp.]
MANTHQLNKTDAGASGNTLLEVVRELFPRESAKPVRHRRRSYIYNQGDPAVSIFCLIWGVVALERIDADGRMAMFGVAKGGSLLAGHDLVDKAPHRNSAQALTTSEMVVIPSDRFYAMLRHDERLLAIVMQQAAIQMSAYEEHILRLSTLDVSDRLYSTLCALVGSPSEECGPVEASTPLLKRDLAAMVGTSPETISRSLRRLEEQEVAEFTGRSTFRLYPPKKRSL